MFLETTANTCALVQNKLVQPLPPVDWKGYKLPDLESMKAPADVNKAADFKLIKLYFRRLTQYNNAQAKAFAAVYKCLDPRYQWVVIHFHGNGLTTIVFLKTIFKGDTTKSGLAKKLAVYHMTPGTDDWSIYSNKFKGAVSRVNKYGGGTKNSQIKVIYDAITANNKALALRLC